jgi:Arc/MetJ-type ribon-helix-helix transcriptional regulator
MPEGIPILVHLEKKELDAIDRLVKEGRYASRSEFMRSSVRLFVGLKTKDWKRRAPEDMEPVFVRMAGGDSGIAAEMYFEDLRKKRRDNV